MKSECLELNPSQRCNISDNLNRLIELKKTTDNRVAQDINIPVMTVRRLLSGETTDPRISTLKLLAEYFDVSIDDLIASNNEINYGVMGQSKPLFIPVLDWSAAQRSSSIDFSKWHEWVPVTVGKNETISARSFALESRPSMFPRFQQGTVFIIDPELSATDGDLVLVKLRENDELTLRELFVDPPDWQLHQLNQGGSALQYAKEKHEIVGVVFLTLFYNRKMRPLHVEA